MDVRLVTDCGLGYGDIVWIEAKTQKDLSRRELYVSFRLHESTEFAL